MEHIRDIMTKKEGYMLKIPIYYLETNFTGTELREIS